MFDRMKRFAKGSGCAAILAAFLTANVTTTADAGYRHRHHHGDIGFGIAGLAAGAVIGSYLAGPRYPYGPGYAGSYRRNYYVGPHPYQPPYGYPMPLVPAPAYYARPAPWSPAWYDYCFARYRSFNPRTGTFTAYSGRQIFCR